MGKRVYEIARELSLGVEEVMERLNDAGIEVKSHFAVVENSAYERVFGGRQPYQVRLPGFVSEEDIGLGEAIKRATSTIGVRPCGGCGRRAAALNRWMVFSGRHPR
jgi:Translation initiation factor IF-2, N-terminal region